MRLVDELCMELMVVLCVGHLGRTHNDQFCCACTKLSIHEVKRENKLELARTCSYDCNIFFTDVSEPDSQASGIQSSPPVPCVSDLVYIRYQLIWCLALKLLPLTAIALFAVLVQNGNGTAREIPGEESCDQCSQCVASTDHGVSIRG